MAESHCAICLGIFIEPVVLPCEHSLCKPCFDGIINKASLQCPFCRRRIGSWARLNTRRGTLIDAKKWDYIKNNFSAEVNARLSGKDTPRKCTKAKGEAMKDYTVVLANTGEIRKEYEKELLKIQEERAKQEEASQKLIREIMAQEPQQLAAFKAADKENKPVKIEQSNRLSMPRRSSSIDSITGEYSRHFKPIVRYPRTPPRPSDKGKGYPDTIKVTPGPHTVKRLDFASSCSPPDVSSSNESLRLEPLPSSTTTTTTGDRLKEKSSVPSCSNQYTDHTFLLPLPSVDDRSNDGLSVVSSSTGNSISTCRLRIATTSPIIPYSPGGLVTRVSTNSESDQWSTSSTDSRSTNGQRRSKRARVTKNGYLNAKSSKSASNGHSNGTRGDAANGVASNAANQSIANGGMASPTSSLKTTISYRSSELEWSPVDNVTTTDTQPSAHAATGPAFIDPDEIYARKLHTLFEMERKYNLTAFRHDGSGNEYYTRRRKRKHRGTEANS